MATQSWQPEAIPVDDLPADPHAHLVALAKTGDHEAWTALYRCHRLRVMAKCRHMLGGGPNAEDAAQDTWLRAWQGMPGFHGDCSFATWVVKIAFHECLRVIRTSHQPSNGDDYLVPLEIEDAHGDAFTPALNIPSPEPVLLTAIDAERILARLSALDARVLTLAYVDETPADEIAARTGATLGAVKARLNRVKYRLRKERKQCQQS